MDQKKVGKFIANLRKERNLTQMQLGEKMGVLDKTVSKWERGVCSPDISLLNDLSEVLNVTTTELLRGEKAKSNISADDPKKINEILLLFLNNYYDNCYIDLIRSLDSNYSINGLVITSDEKQFISINSVQYLVNNDSNEIVYSYEYSLKIEDDDIYKTGYLLLNDNSNHNLNFSMEDMFKSVHIYISKNNNFSVFNLLNKQMCLLIKYINQKLEKKIIQIPLALNELFPKDKNLLDYLE